MVQNRHRGVTTVALVIALLALGTGLEIGFLLWNVSLSARAALPEGQPYPAVHNALDALGRGRTVVIVAHRPVGIEGVDQLLVLKDGRMQAFGPKEQVLGQVLQRVPAPAPIKVVSEGGVTKS